MWKMSSVLFTFTVLLSCAVLRPASAALASPSADESFLWNFLSWLPSDGSSDANQSQKLAAESENDLDADHSSSNENGEVSVNGLQKLLQLYGGNEDVEVEQQSETDLPSRNREMIGDEGKSSALVDVDEEQSAELPTSSRAVPSRWRRVMWQFNRPLSLSKLREMGIYNQEEAQLEDGSNQNDSDSNEDWRLLRFLKSKLDSVWSSFRKAD